MYEEELDALKSANLLRHISAPLPTGTADFGGNDYLGLSYHPALLAASMDAARRYGTGARASRLISGNTPAHTELEARIASLKSAPAALLFGSGFMANSGALPALATAGDAILSDELNHASLIDGCRLSRAAKYIYRHADMGHLEGFLKATSAKRKIIVTDSVFSMEGDIAPLPDLLMLARRHGALLYIDDAHATGVLGPQGRGSLAHFGIPYDEDIIQMGTLSKALGSYGAFIAAAPDIIEWLTNKAHTLIYSTALPAPAAAAASAAIGLSASPYGDTLRASLWQRRQGLINALSPHISPLSATPILPVAMQSAEEALRISRALMDKGYYAPAIRPPTVKSPRLRLTASAAQTQGQAEGMADALKQLLAKGAA